MTPKTTKNTDKPLNRAQSERGFRGSVSWAGTFQFLPLHEIKKEITPQQATYLKRSPLCVEERRQ
jgi:hypothetical protein